MLLAVQCVYSVRLICSKEIVCDIEDIQSIDDFFVNQYVPSDVKSVRYRNVLLDKVEGYFFHAIRRHVKNVDIIQSSALRWISIPGQMNVSSYSVIQTSVRNIQIDARNAITVFSVSDSKLVMIPESISNLKASVNIAVERCLVDALDMAKFCDLSQLQVLNFAANRIRFIINSSTKRCSVYDSLQILALPNNLLTTLNMEIFNHFGKIQMLEVKQNRIKAVLGRFESTASLQLLLSKNKLTSIDFCGWNVPNMTSLEMDYNELTTVPACLDNVNSLTLLSIRTNRIQNVAIDSFAKLKRLVTLDVSFNNLTTIMLNSPHYPTSLRDLWITGNNLSQLDLSLVSVPSLELDVRMNCISSMDVDSISPNITKLNMAANPIDCSWKTVADRINVTCVDDVQSKTRCT